MTINHTDTIKNNDQLKRPYIAPAVTFLSVGKVEAKISSSIETIADQLDYGPS